MMTTPAIQDSPLASDYRTLCDGVALIDRSDRALLEVRGADRLPWLHNLTTNEVKKLQPGDGNYAFAINIKGRIEFDLSMTVLAESVWLDLPLAVRDRAVKHLSKYHITENIELVDRTGDFARLAIAGPRMVDVMTALGAGQAAALAQHSPGEFTYLGETIRYVRYDFCGLPAVDLFVPVAAAAAVRAGLEIGASSPAARLVRPAAVEVRRIEAGLPAWPAEINDGVLPAETAQLDRAVSFQKGCYLGQEVVERMRSRGGLARRLVGVVVEGEAVPDAGAELHMSDGAMVGRVTSACRSIALGRVIALAYAKTAATAPGTPLAVVWDGHLPTGSISALPFV